MFCIDFSVVHYGLPSMLQLKSKLHSSLTCQGLGLPVPITLCTIYCYIFISFCTAQFLPAAYCFSKICNRARCGKHELPAAIFEVASWMLACDAKLESTDTKHCVYLEFLLPVDHCMNLPTAGLTQSVRFGHNRGPCQNYWLQSAVSFARHHRFGSQVTH